MNVLFVAGFSPIVTDPATASTFYRDDPGFPLETVHGDDIAVDGLEGTRHLGVCHTPWLHEQTPLGSGSITERTGLLAWAVESRRPGRGTDPEHLRGGASSAVV